MIGANQGVGGRNVGAGACVSLCIIWYSWSLKKLKWRSCREVVIIILGGAWWFGKVVDGFLDQ